ncbi:MAG: hypothetical protein JSR91_14940 [Proteobacteria bacterium]|nr:hypothetical protein [Pseudomonadota bacterium]
MRIGLRPSDPMPFQVETDRLFLGIFPDPEVAKAISRLTYRLRIGHELRAGRSCHVGFTPQCIISAIGQASMQTTLSGQKASLER